VESGRRALTYLDTHAALWLCTGEVRLSPRALEYVERDDLLVSPVVLLEMRMLQEIGRVNIGPGEWMAILHRDFGVAVCRLPLQRVVSASLDLPWTRDPFDRLIVAQTITANGRLITKDQRIQKNFQAAVW
jgi:PIN domain nuclease of toxin-antitoxin system